MNKRIFPPSIEKRTSVITVANKKALTFFLLSVLLLGFLTRDTIKRLARFFSHTNVLSISEKICQCAEKQLLLKL